MAAQNGHTAMVEILVKAGADVNKVSDVRCGEVLTSRRRRVDPQYIVFIVLHQCKVLIPYCLGPCHVHVHAGGGGGIQH